MANGETMASEPTQHELQSAELQTIQQDSEEKTVKQWKQLKNHVEKEGIDPHQTIRRSSTFPDAQKHELLSQLPELFNSQSAPSPSTHARPPEIKLQGLLAQGGMGQIHNASQLSLQRDVVVKMLRPDKITTGEVERLLQESYVTGLLEHPNIVPVHQLGLNEKGDPMLVMKRIDGILWEDLLPLGSADSDLFEGQANQLEWHIQILIQVCHAVEFAHSKGILHLDLKPSNVMIGEFGEVYLLDWGIAVSMFPQVDGRIPEAQALDEIVGTPMYMAPEMLLEDGSLLETRTDVYLLGATLHKLLTGSAPHQGKQLFELLRDSVLPPDTFEYHPEHPNELVELCKRSLAHTYQRRPESAKLFRQALEKFLRHRDSRKASVQAHLLLVELQGKIEIFPYEDKDKIRSKTNTLYSLYWRCHFGFNHALETWPENLQARSDLHVLMESMAEFELNKGNPKAASILLSDLPKIPTRLQEKLREAEAQQQEKTADAQELKRLRYENNTQINSRARRTLFLFIGGIWGLSSFVAYYWEVSGFHTITHRDMFLTNLCFLLFVIVNTQIWKARLLTNQASRQMFRLLHLGAVVLLMQRGVLISLEIPVQKSLVFEFVTFFVLIGSFANFYSGIFLLPASCYLFGMIGCILYREGVFIFLGLAHLSCTVLLSHLWSETRHEPIYSNEPAKNILGIKSKGP